MTLDRRDDGTIGITLAGKEARDPAGKVTGKAADLLVDLRRPVLEELLDLWQRLDDLDRVKREADGSIRTVIALRANADWFRYAIVTLGPPGVYNPAGTKTAKKALKAVPDEEPASNGQSASTAGFAQAWQLARDDLTEPAWFVSGSLQAVMLGHWQNNPLDLGAEPTPADVPA